jgi:hypothetical protein
MSFDYGTDWRLVSENDFKDFLRRYPRPLTIDPPLTQRARFRRYLDPTLGTWRESEVSTAHKAHRSFVHVIRSAVMSATTATFGRERDEGPLQGDNRLCQSLIYSLGSIRPGSPG